jgi:hypothetical protein
MTTSRHTFDQPFTTDCLIEVTTFKTVPTPAVGFARLHHAILVNTGGDNFFGICFAFWARF